MEQPCSTCWICKNSECGAILSINDAYCRRCSCCICHKFDENKDHSLWLVCESESAQGDSCGLSCHIECAFQREKLGVVSLGQYMRLDRSYCCASCGKVSQILGCLIKQLAIAKDARRVDVMRYRINLSYRLLEGTDKFKALHEIIAVVKTNLEEEVGPLNGDSVKMERNIVRRLAVGLDVQKLCSDAINKANELIANVFSASSNGNVGSLPAACRFQFEKVTSSSLSIILIDIPTPITDSIIGYKLWYCKSQQESFSKEPRLIFMKEKKLISVTHLQPCTEYTFRIISYTETGDLGHSEAKCFTKSVEIFKKNFIPGGFTKRNLVLKDQPNLNLGGSSSGFKIRDLGRRGCLEGVFIADVDQCCGGTNRDESPKVRRSPPRVPHEFDLNVVPIPDLNEDLTPRLESLRDEDNGFTFECAAGPDASAASNGVVNTGLGVVRLDGSGSNGESPSIQNVDVPAVDSLAETRESVACDCRASNGPGSLGCNFEYCVKVICWLESEGYIKQEFRLKLLTWFSLRSTEEERHIVNTFIQALVNDPKNLADQLAHSIGELISREMPRNAP